MISAQAFYVITQCTINNVMLLSYYNWTNMLYDDTDVSEDTVANLMDLSILITKLIRKFIAADNTNMYRRRTVYISLQPTLKQHFYV